MERSGLGGSKCTNNIYPKRCKQLFGNIENHIPQSAGDKTRLPNHILDPIFALCLVRLAPILPGPIYLAFAAGRLQGYVLVPNRRKVPLASWKLPSIKHPSSAGMADA